MRGRAGVTTSYDEAFLGLSHLHRRGNTDRERICVAQPGVDLRVLRPRETVELRQRLGIEAQRVLLFVGRLEPPKGADR